MKYSTEKLGVLRSDNMPFGLVKFILIIAAVELIVELLDHILTFHKGPVVFFGIIVTTILYFSPIDNGFALVSGVITFCFLLHDTGAGKVLEAITETAKEDLEDRKREEEERERLEKEEHEERIKENNRLVRDGYAYKLGRSELRELDDEPNSNLSRATRDWLDKHRDEYDSDF